MKILNYLGLLLAVVISFTLAGFFATEANKLVLQQAPESIVPVILSCVCFLVFVFFLSLLIFGD